MAQTDYANQPAQGVPGDLASTAYHFSSLRNNENASPIQCGIFVKQGTAARGANLLAAASDAIVGVSMKSDAHYIDATFTGQAAIGPSLDFDCMEEGAVWVVADSDAPPVFGGPVYARFAAGTGTVIGAARANHDSNTCRLVAGARVMDVASLSALGLTLVKIWFSRAVQVASADDVDFAAAIASASATATSYIAKTRADRQFVVDGVDYVEPATGIAQNDTNYFVFQVMNGATEVAKFSTKLTGGNGPITAATFTAFIMDALANTVCAPGSVLTLVQTLTGTLTAPAGTLVVHGHYI